MYYLLYGTAYWVLIQQKLPSPVLLFSDFAGRDQDVSKKQEHLFVNLYRVNYTSMIVPQIPNNN